MEEARVRAWINGLERPSVPGEPMVALAQRVRGEHVRGSLACAAWMHGEAR